MRLQRDQAEARLCGLPRGQGRPGVGKRKKAQAASAAAPVDTGYTPGVDKIGAYPRDFDTEALPERRTAAYARMISIIAAAQTCAIIALAFALAALLPLQKVVPMVMTTNAKGDEIVHINPATLDNPTVDYVSEIALRDYVTKRYSIVGSQGAQAANWDQGSVVQLMSTPENYKNFQGQAKVEYNRVRANNMVRSVRIDSVRKLAENTWQVEYVTRDTSEQNPMQGAAPVEQHTWVSTYTVAFKPKNVTYNDRLNNPFGMTILTANDARRD